jgi:hypothetical protein
MEKIDIFVQDSYLRVIKLLHHGYIVCIPI